MIANPYVAGLAVGLTNYIEVITINQYGSINFGRNQFELIDPRLTPTIKEAIAQTKSISMATYKPYILLSTRVKPMSRSSVVPRNSILAFIRRELTIPDDLDTEKKLFLIVSAARLQNAGAHGKFPIVLPSRGKIFR